MNDMLLPILIAASVICVIWVILQAISAALSGEKRRLQERLSQERSAGANPAQLAVSLQLQSSGFSAVLARHPWLAALQQRLAQAYPKTSLASFLGIAAACGALCFLVGAAVSNLLAGIVAGLGGAYLPMVFVNLKRNQRLRAIALQLPEALEFLSRILRAGHSLSTGIQMMGEELPSPIGDEFRRCHSQVSLGQAMDEALRDMARRIESTDFAFFVTAVLIQRQTGGDLSEVLTNISGMIRQRFRLQQHVKAKTAEGRLTGYLLVAFPVVMFGLSYAMNPAHTGKMFEDSTGVGLLVAAVVLQFMGLYAIRKITTLRV